MPHTPLWPILILYAALGCGYIHSPIFSDDARVKGFFKVIPMVVLSLWSLLYVIRNEDTHPFAGDTDGVLLFWGLLCSTIGDACLVFRKVGAFGVIAFAAAQTLYIVLFVRMQSNIDGLWIILPTIFVIIDAVLFSWLYCKLDGVAAVIGKRQYLVFIFLYFVFVSIMCGLGCTVSFRGTSYGVAASIGSFLFWISDHLIVLGGYFAIFSAKPLSETDSHSHSKETKKTTESKTSDCKTRLVRRSVMVTYYAAQGLDMSKKTKKDLIACSWDILTKGGKGGKAARDQRGKDIRNVANFGIWKGDRAVFSNSDISGFSITALGDCKPMLTHERIASAMDDLQKGVDVQTISRRLSHSDHTTVRTLVRAWHSQWDVDYPPEYSDMDPSDLSQQDKQRIKQKSTDFLSVPFVIDSCGFNSATGLSAIPNNWIGRRFDSGRHFHDEASDFKVSHRLLIAPKLIWQSRAALLQSLSAQNVIPAAAVCVEFANDAETQLKVQILPLSRTRQQDSWLTPLQNEKEGDYQYRALLGNEPEADVHKTGVLKPGEDEQHLSDCHAATTILKISSKVLDKCKAFQEKKLSNKKENRYRRDLNEHPLLAAPTEGSRMLLYPASVLQKSIRRGKTLCGPEPVTESVAALLMASEYHVPELQYQKTNGCRIALWKLFMAALEDAGPYLPNKENSKYLSLSELTALALITHADSTCGLPGEVFEEKLVCTALRLQGLDTSSALWPWRGWKWSKVASKKKNVLCIEESVDDVSDVRNAIRVSVLALPVSRGERMLLLKYLGGLDSNGIWAKVLQPLPECPAELSTAGQLTEIRKNQNYETELSAFDTQWRPSLLLFLQAGLPKVPTDTMQHSLRSLAQAVWTLSSGVNVRALKQKLSGAAQETYRFLSFVTDRPDEAKGEITPEKLGIYGGDKNESEQVASKWKIAEDGQRLTPHEKLLLKVIIDYQSNLHSLMIENNTNNNVNNNNTKSDKVVVKCLNREQDRGRLPTAFEARTAFLQLFGAKVAVTAVGSDNKKYSCFVTVAGCDEEPLLVQKMSGTIESGDQTGRKGLSDTTLQGNAITSALVIMETKREVKPPEPPVGFDWVWVESDTDRTKTANIQIKKSSDSSTEQPTLLYFVNGSEIPQFNATSLLKPCNEPRKVIEVPSDVQQLVQHALYNNSTSGSTLSTMELFINLDAHAKKMRKSPDFTHGDVYHWIELGQQSTLPRSVWRDLVIKMSTRESDTIDISKCARDGTKTTGALQQLTEGVLLRVLCALEALYPCVLKRVASSELRFKIAQVGTQYIHLSRVLSVLAFGSYDDGTDFYKDLNHNLVSDTESLFSFEEASQSSKFSFESSSDEEQQTTSKPISNMKDIKKNPMKVTTTMWSHQQEAVHRVVEGVAVGKRGFADASAVGAGKTLSAVASCIEVSKWLSTRHLRRHGFLVLVPNSDLISEWVQQILRHSTGVHVVVQQQTGYLISRGISNGGKPPKAHDCTRRTLKSQELLQNYKVDENTIVISTLGRLRDKPFVSQPGWDFVVIDECLSVQNDSALQTVEAWRQVTASRCGVLMLSATLFRSRMSKLFYMIRMLRSSLPRTDSYLPALLAEHIICYLPERTRTWEIKYQPVSLTPEARAVYESRLSAALRGQRDARIVFGELKTVLRDMWEGSCLLEATQSEINRLESNDKNVLLYANSESQLDSLTSKLSSSRVWSHGEPSKPKGKGPLIVTVQRGAYGLNLQKEANVIICRPQPGDLIEQMKGRIDRPGQETKNLTLVVLYAENTIEEAEAANIRLCGSFFRQYIDPLSRSFQECAIEASAMASSSNFVKPRRGAMGGQIAAAFRKHLEEPEAPEAAPEPKPKKPASKTTKSRKPSAKTSKKDNVKSIEKAAPKKKKSKNNETSSSSSESDSSTDTVKAKNKKKPPAKAAKRKAAPKTATKKSKPEESEEEEEEDLPTVPRKMTTQSAIDALGWLTQRDSQLASVIAAVGPPTEFVSQLGDDPALKSLVRSVVFQQISIHAAGAIFGRLLSLIDGTMTAEKVLSLSDESLKKVGLSGRKIEYIRNIARRFESGQLSDEKLHEMTDEECFEALLSIKGMGEWSTHMFMMFQLGRHDVLPVGDIAVRKAFQKLYHMTPHDTTSETQVQYLPGKNEMAAIAKKWKPYRTIGTWYMWHVIESKDAAYTYGS